MPKYDYIGKVEGYLGIEDIQIRLPTGAVVWKKREEVELINKEE